MNSFQHINFRDVNDFLDYLPEEEFKIVEVLRSIILDAIPNVKEKLSYNVPYYYRFSRICFIWPPSIPWGNVAIKGVQLGFCRGNLLDDPFNFLQKGNRKQVYWKEYAKLKDVEPFLLKSFLYEAVRIDELEHARKAKNK